jgi:hypothetical protein
MRQNVAHNAPPGGGTECAKKWHKECHRQRWSAPPFRAGSIEVSRSISFYSDINWLAKAAKRLIALPHFPIDIIEEFDHPL